MNEHWEERAGRTPSPSLPESDALSSSITGLLGPVFELVVGLASPNRHVVATRFTEQLRNRQRKQVEHLVKGINEPSRLEADVVRRLCEDDELIELLRVGLEAATDTHLEEKARAIGRAIRTALLTSDTARVDEARMLIRTLSTLEVPHIRVLVELQRLRGYDPVSSAMQVAYDAISRKGRVRRDTNDHTLEILVEAHEGDHVSYYVATEGHEQRRLGGAIPGVTKIKVDDEELRSWGDARVAFNVDMGDKTVTTREAADAWPQNADLVPAFLAVLSSHGLIQREEGWVITSYGQRLLDVLRDS